MYYYAKIIKDKNYYLVSFPDFPNINTFGETIETSLKNAAEALNGSIETDFERGYNIPKPKEYNGKQYYKIYVKPHIEIAFDLKYMRAKKSQSEIASKLGITYQAYQKLENPRKCNPTIKTLEKIAKVLNKKIEVKIK